MTFLVAPECIQIKKGFATRGKHQPHPQMHSAHMCTDCSRWGWWPLCTAFNPAFVYSFDAPNWRQKGCMRVGRASSEAGETASNVCFASFIAGPVALVTGHVRSWGGGLEMVVDGEWQAFLWGGGAEVMEGRDMAPSEAHKDLPPLILPPPLQSSQTLQFLGIEPLPPTNGSLPSENSPSLTCLAPWNET